MATDEDRKKFLNFNSIVIPEETWNDVSSNRYAASLIAKDLNTLVQSLYVMNIFLMILRLTKNLLISSLRYNVLTDFAINKARIYL